MPYLMDDLVSAAAVVSAGQAVKREPVLSGFVDMAEKMKGTPRFLLDEAAIHTSVELSLGRPKLIYEAMQHLQVPYERMWIEWPERGREKLRQTFGTNEWRDDPARPLPERIAMLIEAEPGGRRGQVTWFWTGADLGEDIERFPNIAPICPFFDLDAQIPQPADRITGFLKGNLAKIWHDHPVQMEALFSIWRTADHRPSPWGNIYMRSIVLRHGEKTLREQLPYMFSDVYGEYIEIWCVLLMLTASKTVVDYRDVSRAKINKHRAKAQKPPLLDHTEVTLHINPRTVAGRPGQPLGYKRKSPRVHMVSSFLNRRGSKHWIVQPFWRGEGEVIHRQVRVKG